MLDLLKDLRNARKFDNEIDGTLYLSILMRIKRVIRMRLILLIRMRALVLS